MGLAKDPAVLYYIDFDDETETLKWLAETPNSGTTNGYSWTGHPDHVRGSGALEIQHKEGTHAPGGIYPTFAETDVAYMRWYRKWEAGYDFTSHKGPGVYAKNGSTLAGEKPTGYDKYSCRIAFYDKDPTLYTYHPEQTGQFGSELGINLKDPPVQVEADRWYCFEMMIRANTVGKHDGELKMWVDGELVSHFTGYRFRDTADLKISELSYTAYVGGSWTSKRDQKLWDDQIVVAREYIGPMSAGSLGGAAGAAGSGGSAGGSSGSGGSTATGGLGNDAGPDAGGTTVTRPRGADSGCECRTGVDRRTSSSTALIGLLALFGIDLRRRRRTFARTRGQARTA